MKWTNINSSGQTEVTNSIKLSCAKKSALINARAITERRRARAHDGVAVGQWGLGGDRSAARERRSTETGFLSQTKIPRYPGKTVLLNEESDYESLIVFL